MQEQQIRQYCNAIAAQVFLIAPSHLVNRGSITNAPAATSNTAGVTAAAVLRGSASANSQGKALTTSASTTSSNGGGGDGRSEELRRLSEAVVRDAMTLYRLCHRPDGTGVAIVRYSASSSFSSVSGGGRGAVSAVEEAAFCVCAAIMSREPPLWASLARRAQLLRPRKPTLCFAPPVMVPPIAVKDVAKFYERSRRVVAHPRSSALGIAPATSTGTAADSSTIAAAAGVSGNEGSDLHGVLSAQQAEAIAAAFFFKTMSATARRRKPEIFEVRVTAPSAVSPTSRAGVASPAPQPRPKKVPPDPTANPAEVTGNSSNGYSSSRGAAPSSPQLPLPFSSALSTQQHSCRGLRRPLSGASVSSSSSLLYLDDWAGWLSGRRDRRDGTDMQSVRGVEEQSGLRCGGRGVSGAWSSRSNSSDSSESTTVSNSSSGGGGESGTHDVKACGGDGHATHSTGRALTCDGSALRQRRKDAKRAEMAVLERLYHIATSVDAAADLEAEQGDGPAGDFEEGEAGSLRTAARSATGFATNAAASTSSLFTAGNSMGMVSLAAMKTQVQDALHWGRLTALVRFPLLLRALSTPRLFTATADASSTAKLTAPTTALSDSSEALTAAAMACMNDALGSSYTSAALSTSDAQAAAALDDVIHACGSPGSFFCPSRLRPLSLLPRPPSLVTDTFLWTRLLICGAWLNVYADGLISGDRTSLSSSSSSLSKSDDDDDGDDDGNSVVAASCWNGADQSAAKLARPRVRSSPLVQETVKYCAAVVKEASAISASMVGSSDAAAACSSRLTPATRPPPNMPGPFRQTGSAHDSAVCCPVCDRLIKEQQPVLWWSTLHEDRAQLREQVRSLLENGSATEAEARVAATVAADGLSEGRGGRQYTAAQFSGSGAASERVAALQGRWGSYIMGAVSTSSTDAFALGGGCAGTGEEVHDVLAAEVLNEEKEESDDTSAGSASAGTLWAALTQRVAAAVDLCAFMSTHPLTDEQDATTSAAVPKHTRVRRGATTTTAAAAARARKRRRHASSSSSSTVFSEDEEEEKHSSIGSSSGDEASESTPRSRRQAGQRLRSGHGEDAHETSDVDSGAEAVEEAKPRQGYAHCRRRRHRCRSQKRGGDNISEMEENPDVNAHHNGHSGEAELTVDEAARSATTTTTARTPNTFTAFHGSRHAHEVAEEWEKLLRRCGWVNATPPPPPDPSADVLQVTMPPAPVPAPSVYARWAASLVLPTAIPTSQQAAVLRRRLSRYSLEELVRALVLGRGGMWSQYAALMFGADARVGELQEAPLMPRSQEQSTTDNVHQGDLAKRTCALEPLPVAKDADTPCRAASMSLLNEESETTGRVKSEGSPDSLASRDSLLLVSEHADDAAGAHDGGEDKKWRRETQSADRSSSSPPALTSQAAFIPLSPPPPLRRLPHSSTKSSPLLSSTLGDLASTPTRKSALPSIPLHVSPLTLHAAAAAAAAATTTTDRRGDCSGNEMNSACAVAGDRGRLTSSDLSCRSHLRDEAPAGQNSLGVAFDPRRNGAKRAERDQSAPSAVNEEEEEDLYDGGAVARSRLRAQQAAIRALLRFHPRFPPLREEDAVLECGSCFSLFHQDCVAPVQRDLMGQVFLCHTCRLKWARPYVDPGGAGGGLIHQAQAFPF